MDRENYLASVLADIEAGLNEIEANPVYTILNVCRTRAYVQEGRLFSKEEGGAWAKQRAPQQFPGLIKKALAIYRGAPQSGDFSPEDLRSFAAEMRREFRIKG